MSYLIKGVVKGVKEVPYTHQGSTYTKMFVGIESEKAAGYQGETVITDVQISKKQMQAGLPAYYESIRGQEVTAPVFIMPWKNGGGYTVFFEGEGKAASANGKK